MVVGDRKMAVFDDTVTAGKLQVFRQARGLGRSAARGGPGRGRDAGLLRGRAAARGVPAFPRMRGGPAPAADGRGQRRGRAARPGGLSALDGGWRHPRRAPGARCASPPTSSTTATSTSRATIGEGTRIWHFSHVMPGARIGRGLQLRPERAGGHRRDDRRQRQDPEQRLRVRGRGAGGRRLLRALHGVHQRAQPAERGIRKREYRPTLVRRGATIGANATVICGHDHRALCLRRGGRGGHPGRAGLRARAGVAGAHAGWMCAAGCAWPPASPPSPVRPVASAMWRPRAVASNPSRNGPRGECDARPVAGSQGPVRVDPRGGPARRRRSPREPAVHQRPRRRRVRARGGPHRGGAPRRRHVLGHGRPAGRAHGRWISGPATTS